MSDDDTTPAAGDAATAAPTPRPPDVAPMPVSDSASPFGHLAVDHANAARCKAEFAARMKESAKHWPGRGRKRRKG